MSGMDDRIAQLETELAEMKKLISANTTTPATVPTSPRLAANAEEVNRRALIRKGGLALAGAAAGGAALMVAGASLPAPRPEPCSSVHRTTPVPMTRP
jgi:hypothetical protein